MSVCLQTKCLWVLVHCDHLMQQKNKFCYTYSITILKLNLRIIKYCCHSNVMFPSSSHIVHYFTKDLAKHYQKCLFYLSNICTFKLISLIFSSNLSKSLSLQVLVLLKIKLWKILNIVLLKRYTWSRTYLPANNL